ncbi:hypothetical protein [Methylobacterium gnaphalii]|uniref:Bacterial collagen-like protein middle domain-containing protein n=1 Tax=Methylobacterium gnaphalii TaxID=1010610 RepID=A0A512JRW9_9HYPH|nr:hypothetical protein [Methylobacterium gnaphalii]GEP12652.1 hypothetical protein MGN01_44970 [Methylobacterium gnaphalii]GJD71315.1 hypothetical protein MMMDOFMJ_4271 [Methylobacterium gnaphalii]GLS48823.1 hypothetical protein GCM10007885_16690 [Methylobacterium gnaphalii]
MSASILSTVTQPLRSLEWLMAPDALLSSTALSTGQLGSLGPITSLIDTEVDLSSTQGATSGLLEPITEIANQTVLDFHAALENAGHEITPVNGPIHGLTNLGETIGLGKLGEPEHLLTDATALPQAVLGGGGLSSATPILNDVSNVLGVTDRLIGAVTNTTAGGNLLSSNGLLAPVSNLANTAVLNFHADIEGFGHDVPLLNDAVHGLTNLGETVGLGHLGTDGNLLTDLVSLPGDLLGGQGLEALPPILADVGSVTGAATGLLQDVIQIPGSLLGGLTGDGGGILAPVTSLLGGLTGGEAGSGLGGILGGLTGDGGLLSPVTALLGGVTGDGDGLTGNLLDSGGLLQPVGDAANGLIDGIHANLENLGHDLPLLNDPLHQVINLGTTVGLGALGDGTNLLTDVVNLPGSILSGDVAGGLDHVVGDLGSVVGAAGGVVGSVPGLLDGVLGGLTGSVEGSTGGNILAPVTSILEGVTGGSDGSSIGDGLLSPVTSILDGVTGGDHGSPVDGILAPVTSILDGVTGGGGGSSGGGLLSPVTSLVGGLAGGGGEGEHPLIDISAGPTTSTPAANVGVLTPPAELSHAVQVGAVSVGTDQPSLLSANLLSGDSLPLPASGGAAGDSLVGQALELVHTASSDATGMEASHQGGLDLGLISIDLGGHTDVHHSDPTPHSSTGGLHLLGL